VKRTVAQPATIRIVPASSITMPNRFFGFIIWPPFGVGIGSKGFAAICKRLRLRGEKSTAYSPAMGSSRRQNPAMIFGMTTEGCRLSRWFLLLYLNSYDWHVKHIRQVE
jgi:hypothetical protein